MPTLDAADAFLRIGRRCGLRRAHRRRARVAQPAGRHAHARPRRRGRRDLHRSPGRTASATCRAAPTSTRCASPPRSRRASGSSAPARSSATADRSGGITTATALWTSAALGLAARRRRLVGRRRGRGPDARRPRRAAAGEHAAGGADGAARCGRSRSSTRRATARWARSSTRSAASGTAARRPHDHRLQRTAGCAGWRSTCASRDVGELDEVVGSLGDLPEVSRCVLRPRADYVPDGDDTAS